MPHLIFLSSGQTDMIMIKNISIHFKVISLLVFAAAVVTVGCQKSEPLPLAGKDPIYGLLVVEDHGQALARWAEAGIRDAVVVNFDAHDDIRFISEQKINELKDIIKRNDWKRLSGSDSVADDGLYHIGNWIYAGARLGIIKEVYWVIPNNLFSQEKPEELMRGFLEHNMFSLEDINTFVFKKNKFQGIYHGIPFTICGIEELPEVNEPVLLSIDADLFSLFTKQYSINYLSALNWIFTALSESGYRVLDAVVSYSVNGEYLKPHHRWIGDELAAVLRDPGILEQPPSKLLPLLQDVDDAYNETDPSRMLKLIEGYTDSDKESSLLLYKAYAHMLEGENDKAYSSANAGCEADRLYCTGLPFMGLQYFLKGECEEADKFFRAGYSQDPDMRNGLYYFAHCLRDLGQMREAILYYRRDVVLNGSFPTDFLIFESLIMANNRLLAIAALKEAVSGLERNPYAEVVNRKAADAIYSAIDFSEKNELKEVVRALKGSKTVLKMFRDYPVE